VTDKPLAALTCTCGGPSVNTNVDGNGGHNPFCPANPKARQVENLTVCCGCGIPFAEPVSIERALADFPDLELAEYACEGCDGN